MNKFKNNKLLIICLVITIIILSSCNFNVIKGLSDDNYSTYLYNQNINVDNDKAHLLSEQSDGSNSYRNIFQSNFLFPAKLQSNMLSTSATSVFSHYSFNQFYFDNLNNDYAYKSNDVSENFIESIVPNDFEVEKGTNIVNGSLESQDSTFGKYNTTYSFDDYQETESNYGNYNGSYLNNNQIGNTNTDIDFIDYIQSNSYAEVLSIKNNHTSVLDFYTTGAYWCNVYNYPNNLNFGTLEFWFLSDSTNWHFTQLFESGNRLLLFGTNSNYWKFFNQTLGSYENLCSHSINIWYHVKIKWYVDDTYSLYINGIQYINNADFDNNQINGLNQFSFRLENIIGIHSFIDGFGYDNIDDYNENDNTNPYGLQTELEQDFIINYQYGSSISIIDNGNSLNNIINLSTETAYYPKFKNLFSEQNNGIIDFQIKVLNAYRQVDFQVYDASKNPITLSIRIDKFQYYDSGWNDIGLNCLDNTWYYLSIHFNSTSDKWSLYIDNILYLDNINYRTDYGSIGNLDSLVFYINTISNNFYINNIDYSWSNGYYENRINDVIPLNDSNYNMYKSTDINNFILTPISDIDVNLGSYPSIPTTHYDKLETNDIDNFVYALPIHNDTYDHYGLSNVEIKQNVYKIKVYISVLKSDIHLISNDSKVNLFDGNSWLGSVNFTANAFEYAIIDYEVDFNNTQINNLEIKITSPSAIEPDPYGIDAVFEISHVYLECYQYPFLEITTEKEIEYNENGIPILNTLYYSFCSDLINNFTLYIYNYDLNNYYEIKTYQNNLTFNIYSFEFNESAYFRFNKFKIKIDSEYNISQFNIYIDLFYLNITYILPNSLGYQEIIVYNQRYDNSDVYKGYSRFELQIYNNSLKYRYSEINLYSDDYIYSWTEINTSNIVINNIELQSHIRYGLNTLDIEIINFYYIIYINYDDDLTIEFMEQSRKELNCHKIKSSFNYTSYTRNYLNLTGIIGNYSYNVFKGCRSLYGLTSETFHRYFIVPYFSQDIDVNIILDLPDDIISNPDEPEPPTQYYWSYETFKTEYHQTSSINIGNWTIEFKLMKSVSYKAKHFYQPNYVSKDDLGSWRWKIKFTDSFSYRVSFNFMRNALKTVLNLVLLFFQFIFYLVVASLSYVLMFIGTSILVFIWNILVYHVFYALMFVLWYLYEGLYLLLDAIWMGLIWLYENYLIPFYVWFTEIAIPYLVEFIIIPAIAFTLTLVIWIITLGNVDFWTLYDTIHEQLLLTSDIMIDVIMELIDNIVVLIYFVVLYLLLTLMCFLKHIICKARGYTNRSNSLYDSFEVYIYPIILFYNLCMKIKDLLAQWV